MFDLLKEEIKFTIPSFELRAEGRMISSIIFVTENFIAEARIDPDFYNYDIAKRKTIFNFRFQSDRIKKNNDDGAGANFYTIHKLTIGHVNNIVTTISLIDSPELLEKWKTDIFSAFPLADLVC